MSEHQGEIYTNPKSVQQISPFIDFHQLNMDEYIDPISSYKNFNEFFYRKIKPEARPIDKIVFFFLFLSFFFFVIDH